MTVASEISGACPSDSRCAEIKPPMIAPTKKRRFQRCDFQSKLKKSQLAPAPMAEQRVRKFDEKPKLLPSRVSVSMIRPTSPPPTYHGQGCNIQSISCFYKAKVRILSEISGSDLP